MKPKQVEASWEEEWPVNWEFIGMVAFDNEKFPEFLLIEGVKYEKS